MTMLMNIVSLVKNISRYKWSFPFLLRLMLVCQVVFPLLFIFISELPQWKSCIILLFLQFMHFKLPLHLAVLFPCIENILSQNTWFDWLYFFLSCSCILWAQLLFIYLLSQIKGDSFFNRNFTIWNEVRIWS
jgi:hypothetical protein